MPSSQLAKTLGIRVHTPKGYGHGNSTSWLWKGEAVAATARSLLMHPTCLKEHGSAQGVIAVTWLTSKGSAIGHEDTALSPLARCANEQSRTIMEIALHALPKERSPTRQPYSSSFSSAKILSSLSLVSFASWIQRTLAAIPPVAVTAPSGTLPVSRSPDPTRLMHTEAAVATRARLKL